MRQVKIKNLLFDLGNVLIDLDKALWKARLLEFFDVKSEDDVDPIIKQKMLEYERGDISTSLFINHMLRQAPRDRQALDVINTWNSILVGIKYNRIDVLDKLTENFNLYVFSNTNELHIEWVDKYLMKHLKFPAFYGLFEEIFLSHEIRASKPHPEAYSIVCQRAGIKAKETLFFDDSQENLDAAAKLGFHTVLVPETKEIVELIDELGLLDS